MASDEITVTVPVTEPVEPAVEPAVEPVVVVDTAPEPAAATPVDVNQEGRLVAVEIGLQTVLGKLDEIGNAVATLAVVDEIQSEQLQEVQQEIQEVAEEQQEPPENDEPPAREHRFWR